MTCSSLLLFFQESKAPNVLAMVHTSNDLAMLVPAEILAETSTQAMAKVIVSFIKVRQKIIIFLIIYISYILQFGVVDQIFM